MPTDLLTRAHALTLDQYISHLQLLRRTLGGDVIVEKWTPAKGRHFAPTPSRAYRLKAVKLSSGKTVSQETLCFWHPSDGEEYKGDVVIRV